MSIAVYHYFYARDIEWYTAGENLERIKIIKNKIMLYGVLGTCMCSNENFISNNIHYQPPSSGLNPNHAVAIIGWDDHKGSKALKPGAWLVKNSHGSYWGDRGYFWISYYDKHCCQHSEMGAVSFQNIEPMRYDHVYYHDYHGSRDAKADWDEAFNAFTMTSTEAIEAISFYTAVDSVEYIIKIFDRFEEGNLQDELAEKSGSLDHTGFHTVDLDTFVRLSAGDDFYIYLYLSHGGQPLDRTSKVSVLLGTSAQSLIVKSSAGAGESYYFDGVRWQDLFDYDFGITAWNSTANFCIKALTTTSPPDNLASYRIDKIPESYVLEQNYPNPFNNSTMINYQLPTASQVDLGIYNLLGQKVATLVSEKQPAGSYNVQWDTFGFASGVYLYKMQTDQGFAITKKLLLLK